MCVFTPVLCVCCIVASSCTLQFVGYRNDEFSFYPLKTSVKCHCHQQLKEPKCTLSHLCGIHIQPRHWPLHCKVSRSCWYDPIRVFSLCLFWQGQAHVECEKSARHRISRSAAGHEKHMQQDILHPLCSRQHSGCKQLGSIETHWRELLKL